MGPSRRQPREIDDAAGPGPAARRGWRLTVYFAVLVAVTAAAASAAAVYVFVQTDRDSRHSAERDTAFSARTAAKDLGNSIATLRATVTSVAASPNVDKAAQDPSCSLSFALTGGVNEGHIDVLRPDGSVACSSRPHTGKAPLKGYTGAAWLKQATARPVLLGPLVDAATGARSVVAAAPTPGHGFVAAFVALEPVGHSLVTLYGGGHPIVFLVTSADGKRVVTRSIDPARWIGAPISGTPFARATGTVRPDLDGNKRIYERATVPGAGWNFYAGEEESAALAAGHRLRDRQLLIILAGFLLFLLTTLLIYRRVAVPIRRLGSHVRSTAALAPPEPVPVAGPVDVSELGDDINTLIASVRDELVRRQRAEETTKESEKSYRRLFENSPLPMWIHDAETGAVFAVNDAAVSRYGYSRDEFLTLKTGDLAAPGENANHESADILDVVRHVRKDGRELKARRIAHSLTFNGRPARCVIAEDVGERERLESQLRQAQKMEAIGQLAGGVAHDFNNLLTVIAGYGEIARTRIGAGPGARELDEIGHAAERAAQLTHQLLAFARQQVLDPVVLDLNEVVDSIIPMLARLIGEDVEMGVLAGDDAPAVLADRGQVEQVIVNLAVNARDAMPNGGVLTIDTREVVLDQTYAAEHSGVAPGTYACLSVTDTGTGIDRETQARIFDPFFTTKEVGAGTGLGLATVHGIVVQSGGHVEVYSEPGIGTSFKVYLPAVTEAPAVPGFKPIRRPAQLTGDETVLVCEDDPSVRVLIQTMLRESGYDVLSTSGPMEALELAAGHPDPIHVLVTDVVMPQLSGPQLVQRLLPLRPGLRILFLSGYSADTIRGQGLPEDSAFLQKPFDAVSLVQRIRALLDTPAQASASTDR